MPTDLDLVVVAARDDKRLRFVEVHPPDGPVVLIEPVAREIYTTKEKKRNIDCSVSFSPSL